MGNAEKAVALSLLLHTLLMAAAAAFFGLSDASSCSPALDLTSVELSLSDNEDESSVFSEVSPMPAQSTMGDVPFPSQEPLDSRTDSKMPEAVTEPQGVEIPQAGEPAVEMRFEKPLQKETLHAADQARIEAAASPKQRIKPKYPRGARRRGEEGMVKLSVGVDVFGAVSGVSITLSSGFKELDEAAVKAVKKALFTPASADGRSVDSTVALTFVFKLK
jgi:protein TonB